MTGELGVLNETSRAWKLVWMMGVGNAPGAHGWGLGKRAESVSKCMRPETWGQVRAHSS